MLYYSGPTLVGAGGTAFQDGSRDVTRISGIAWNTAGLALQGFHESKDYAPKLGDLTVTASLPLDLINDVQFAAGSVTDESYSGGGDYWSNTMITDAATAGGSSGAPVFDGAARLVGIHVGGWSTGGLELSLQILLR